MTDGRKDWDPGTYARFRGLRLRPALDLLAQVHDLPAGDVVDLGCGDGAVAGPLRARFPGRRLVGVDSSPAMLAQAVGHDATVCADIAAWEARGLALIFSNAALHWLGDHGRLMPRLAGMLAQGGVLAVQMPRQFHAPSHRFLRDIAGAMFPHRFDFARWQAPVATAAEYHAMLSGLGAVEAWETEYVQRLEVVAEGHPVRRFTESTAMRPFVAKLDAEDTARFVAAYEEALAAAYPVAEDGTVLFPFRRVFLTLRV